MLKYNYQIKRNEGDEIKYYKPNLIPKELSDVVYIEGPNSSGKSTLLNIIALAFFGLKLKKEELSQALRERLLNLIDSEHQDITFDIEIQNKNSSILLSSSKKSFDNKQIIVKRKIGKKDSYLSPEQFQKEYRLIYDIPSDPLERLPQLLLEIKNAQNNRGIQVTRLRHLFREEIDSIRDSRNPEQILDLKTKLNKEIKNKDNSLKEIGDNENYLNDFQRFYFSKVFLDYKYLLDKTKEELKKLEGSKKETKSVEKNQSKTVNDLMNKIATGEKTAWEFNHKATILLKSLVPDSDRHHLHLWIDSDLKDEIENPEVYQTLRHEADHFINSLPNLINPEDEEKIIEANCLRSLLKVLEDYSQTNFTILETNKKVTHFIDILDKKIKEFDDISIKNLNISECISHLEEMVKNIKNTIKNIESFKKIQNDHGKTLDQLKTKSISSDIKQFNAQKKYLEEKLNYFSKELIKINIEGQEVENVMAKFEYEKTFSAYKIYTENQLLDKLNSLNDDLNTKKDKLTKLEKYIATQNIEIKRLEGKKPHKYQNYLSQMEEFFKIIQQLEKKLSVTFVEFVDTMIKKERKISELNSNEKKYAERIAEYLAEKVRHVRHIDNDYLT